MNEAQTYCYRLAVNGVDICSQHADISDKLGIRSFDSVTDRSVLVADECKVNINRGELRCFTVLDALVLNAYDRIDIKLGKYNICLLVDLFPPQ